MAAVLLATVGAVSTPKGAHWMQFVREVSERPSSPCDETGYQRIERLARLLSAAAAEATPGLYKQIGQAGVFLQGVAGQPDYKQVKTRFMHRHLCQMQPQPTTICEVGFMAGHTSMLFLESVPDARMLSFDWGNYPWTSSQGELMRDAYGRRFNITFGLSQQTLPKFHKDHPDAYCDVVFVDGSKVYENRLLDLQNFKHMSTTHAAVFFDEVCDPACVRGHKSCGEPWPGCHMGSSEAYAVASRIGLLNVTDCDFPPGHMPSVKRKHEGDGTCVARYCGDELCPMNLPLSARLMANFKRENFWDNPQKGAAKLVAQDFGV